MANAFRANGISHSVEKRLPTLPSSVAIPITPFLSETPPTPDTQHDDFDLSLGRHGRKSALSKPSHSDHIPSSHPHTSYPHPNTTRGSSADFGSPHHRNLAPGRTSSENTSISIFSMYTDEVGAIPEAPNETSSQGHSSSNSHSSLRMTRQLSSPPRSRVPSPTLELPDSNAPPTRESLAPTSVAAFMLGGRDFNRLSASSHRDNSPQRVSVPESILLPYDSRPMSQSSLSSERERERTRNSQSHSSAPREVVSDDSHPRLSQLRSSHSSYARASSTKSPRTSHDLNTLPRSDSPATIYPPLPPSRNTSRASFATSNRHSESSPLPPAPRHLSPDPVPQLRESPSAHSVLSQPPSHRGVDEEADAEYVRSVYAQFDSCGVPGDGYEDGVERTRARLSSAQLNEVIPATEGGDLGEKETKRLRNVDRYGFFIQPMSVHQEARMTLLARAPLARKVKRLKDAAPPPPKSQPPSPPELKNIPKDKPPTHEMPRLAKWQSMMRPLHRDVGGNVDSWSASGKTFVRRVWKGIPDRWRPAAWQLLIENAAQQVGKQSSHSGLAQQYRDTIDSPSKQDVQIDLDVPRTINDHVLFHTRYGQGQRALFHTLHCFSLRCSLCEYVQGMGPIAATLLLYFNAEATYSHLVHIHDEYNMHSVFQPGFPGLLEAIYVQERLMEKLMPSVYQAFQKHGITATAYVTKWYITLFANSFPFQTQLRIWDAFFLEGRDVIVIVAVAIIWDLKDYLSSSQASFETILSLLSSFFVPEDEDAFMDWVRVTLSSPDIRSAMNGWRREWAELVATGQDHKALL